MTNLMKRSMALLLALFLCLSLLPANLVSVDAANYIYNWGTRGTTATSLSENAKAFYTGSNTYDALAALSGGTGASDAPASSLYTALKNLMAGKQSYQTSYDATRSLFKYTDCQNGGGKISSFYSGKDIGPAWDSGATWNREHTWPNSKGNASGNGENDIMMLRPTATSENGSRGNKAYGESSGYYNPNGASGGSLDLRGDVSRILLYVYVRWGNTGSMWGSSGVIESLDVLIRWMEADPVDTWELGRNDSVQSITGTRNVFVDYPELAFLLFGEEIPNNMTTPSGEAANAVNCDHNYVAGKTVAPTCTTDGYTVYTCSLCSKSYQGDKVAASHKFVNGTCTVCGEVTYDVAGIPVPGTAYKFVVQQNGLSGSPVLGITGEMDTYYYATTETVADMIDVYLEETTGGYHIYFMDGTTKTYLDIIPRSNDATKTNVVFQTSGEHSVYVLNTEFKYAMTAVNGTDWYLGTYGTYKTISASKTSFISDTSKIGVSQFCAWFATNGAGGSVEPEQPTCEHTNTKLEGAKDATCIENGHTGKTVCNDCGATVDAGKVITATGHNFVDGTCSVCGATDPNYTPDEPKTSISNGDKVVIWVPGYNKALSTTKTSHYNVGVDVILSNGVLTGYGDTEVFTVIANDDGTFSFANNGQNIGLAASFASMNLGTEHDKWELTDLGDGLYLVKNTGRGNYMEWYNQYSNWSTFNSDSAATDPQFQISFYIVESTEPEQPTCEHTETKIEGAKDATCTDDGHTGKTVCTACGEVISVGEVIPSTGHSYENGTCTGCGEADPDQPVVSTSNKADFNTIVLPSSKKNGDSSYTATYTTANGWVTKNCAIQCGGTTDTNPQFTVIGPDNTHKAPCLNGGKTVGSITSPTLTGGISKLTMKYTKMFTDTKLSVTITITDLATGTTYTQTVARDVQKDTDKYVVWDYEWVLETPITGDFTIVVVNDCPTGSSTSKNKDRFTILELAWEAPAAPACQHQSTTVEGRTEATCTTDGHTGKTVCAKCGETINEGSVIPATGHNFVDGTCTVCGAADPNYTPEEPACEHTETKVEGAKDATCTVAGHTGKTVCAKCGEIISEGEEIPATGHTNTKVEGAKAATCTEDGFTGKITCTDCGEVIDEGEVVKAPGHKYVDHFCSGCGQMDPDAPKYDVYFLVPEGVDAVAPMVSDPRGIALPTANNVEGYTFLGWVTNAVDNVTEQVKYLEAGETYVAQQDVVLYALYRYEKTTVVEPTSGTATISFASTAQRTEFNSNKQVWEQNGITVTNLKAASTSAVANYYNPARFYAGSSLNIAHPGMTKIEFTCDASKYATALKNSVSGATASGSNVTVTLSEAQDSLNIANLTAQVRIKSIKVTYTTPASQETVTYYTTVIGDACTHSNTTFVQKDATCTETGYKDALVCSDCNTVLSGEVIAALGHEAGAEATCDTAQTCTRCNHVLVEALGHEAGAEATCETAQTCIRCDHVFAEALGHKGGAEATCETAQFCTRCDQVIVKALGHKGGAAATCTTAQYCTRCDEMLESALGHNMVKYAAQEPTCTEIGWEAYEACSRCSKTTYKQIAAKGHSYESVVTDPTCDEEGYTTNTCSVCGDSNKTDTVKALGHKLGHVAANDATTDAEGNIEYWHCETCQGMWTDEACTKSTTKDAVVVPKLEVPATDLNTTITTTGTENEKTPVYLLGGLAVLVALAVLILLGVKKFGKK